MNASLQVQQKHCSKHNKSRTILLVHQAKYVCEDCAIFDPIYKIQEIIEQQAVHQELATIAQRCSVLSKQEKRISEVGQRNLSSFMRTVQNSKLQITHQINHIFEEIKTKLSQEFIKEINLWKSETNQQGKTKINQIKTETSKENKIMKYHQYQQTFQEYEREIQIHMQEILNLSETIKNQLQTKLKVQKDIIKVFQPLLNIKFIIKNQNIGQESDQDENLLDFSEFLIPQNFQLRNKQHLQQSFVSWRSEKEEDLIVRRKTAASLEESTFTMEDSQVEKIQIQKINTQKQSQNERVSLLSDRSSSCISTISKYQEVSKQIISFKESSKKNTIEITSQHQLSTKLCSISPSIKQIRFLDLQMSGQDFSKIMKEKISCSFVTSIEIVNCPKLTEKILMDIKNYKCKGLKRVSIRDCREITWEDKKVKEIVKKLENQGLKIVH